MEMKAVPLVAFLLFSLLFSGFVAPDKDGDGDGEESTPASSSLAAPCTANLSVTPAQLIPFNTSSLSCYTAWSARDFILMVGLSRVSCSSPTPLSLFGFLFQRRRLLGLMAEGRTPVCVLSVQYKKEGPSLWSFVLSAPDNKGYISVGFSPNGRMVGSSAVAGWITGGGPGRVKQYNLMGKTPGRCPPDQGSLQLVNNSVIISQSSRLYLSFQLNTTQPRSRLIYALGPQGSLPGSDNLLPVHQDMVSTSVDYANGDHFPSSIRFLGSLSCNGRRCSDLAVGN